MPPRRRWLRFHHAYGFPGFRPDPTVKDVGEQDMREQLRRGGKPGPKVIGVDEIAIKKRHTYRIVVSDLVRKRPIWFGGLDRSEASMDKFFKWLGAKKSAGIRMVVM